MDLGVVGPSTLSASPAGGSPCGSPEHCEISEVRDLPPDSFVSSSPPRVIPLVPQASDDVGDIGVDPKRMERERSVSPPPVGVVTDEDPESRRSPFGALGFMDVDGEVTPSALGLEGKKEEVEAGLEGKTEDDEEGDGEEDVIAIDEESLTALERIFICAKSEISEERVRVAYHLPEWIRMVDIGEAVEYVLPLLAGLATDGAEEVKEVFAPRLDELMWHFFSKCPLSDLAPTEGDESTPNSPTGSPVPSRYTPLPDLVKDSPTSTHFPSEDSGTNQTAPSTTKTSPSHTEVSDTPRIPVTAFTSLLGALLTDQSTIVANSTQATLVRFLCRLKGKPMLPQSPDTSPTTYGLSLPPPPSQVPQPDLDSSPDCSSYEITEEARQLLEDEVISGIVIGLARLDDDEREGEGDGDGERGMEGVEDDSRDDALADSTATLSDGGSLSNSLVLSPEEDLIEETWSHSTPGDMITPGPTAESWGEPLQSYFNDGQDQSTRAMMPESSPADQIFSSFSPDGHGDEESAIGKLVSMSLITAIAATDCLDPEVLVSQLLPEVDRMKSESMFYVRKEAVQALASLSRTLPAEVFESSVLPLYSTFSQDTLWHVRRAAVLALPAIAKRLSPEVMRNQAVESIKSFSGDSSRNVRSGALEVCGELIYLFHGDPAGVPDELVAFFLGQPISQASASAAPVDDEIFAPLSTALDSPPQVFYDPSVWSTTSRTSSSRDPDRPVMCAFNLPAVALTLGGDNWSRLREYYLSLCGEKGDKVRQSLASSLHEIVKIIGPEQAANDLLEPFSNFLRDYDYIQGAVLENLSSVLFSVGPGGALRGLHALTEAWPAIKVWRRREAVAKELVHLIPHFLKTDAADVALLVLAKACKDPVASVREQAAYAIPPSFAATSDHPVGRNKLSAFLSVFGEDSSYRHRVTYTTVAFASVRAGMGREDFENTFLDVLARLARDGVVNVRIAVARVVAEACRSSSLYADPNSRAPVSDLLQYLAHLPDRDVQSAVSEFCVASPTSGPPSPSPTGLDRSGAQSRLEMHEDDSDDEARPPLPVARRSAADLHGIDDDDDGMDEVPLDSDAPVVSSEVQEAKDETPVSTEDVEMMDGVLLEPTSPSDSFSPMLGVSQPWNRNLETRELEGEDEFLEVSRR